MEKFKKRVVSFIALISVLFLFLACSPMNTANDDGENQNNEEEVEKPTEKDKEESSEEVEKEEKEAETDQEKEISLTVYQADDQLMYLEKVDTQFLLEENESKAEAFGKLFRGEMKGNEGIFLFPEGTEINSLELNDQNIVEIDLSSEYVSNMNAGSSGEQFFLQGLINTLANYYDVQEVLLTVDGETYQTGHYSLSEGETVSFDDSLVGE